MNTNPARLWWTGAILAVASGQIPASPAVPASALGASAAYGELPFTFEANGGQTDAQVEFLARGPGYNLFLTSREAVLSLRPLQGRSNPAQAGHGPSRPGKPQAATDAAVLRLTMVGANADAVIQGETPLPGKVNYLRGSDPSNWRTGLPTFSRVRYQGVYPGIDLVYYGTQGQLEYDFVLAPGADPKAIQLAFSGADSLRLDASGNLILAIDGAEVTQRPPLVYQETSGERDVIQARYVLADNGQVGVELGAYDATHPLVVDPVLEYSTYLGGRGSEYPSAVAVDEAGNAYVTGYTDAPTFPTKNAVQPVYGGNAFDGFVAKLSRDGSTLLYSSYLGGSGWDGGYAIAVDAAGQAHVTGFTDSADFPTEGALQPRFGGGPSDGFVTKLSADGRSLIYSSYLGGDGDDTGFGIALNASGQAHVAGSTNSTDFPTRNALSRTRHDAASDAFVSKLTAAGNGLVYSTYLGGKGPDWAKGIALDSAGGAYVVGNTGSSDFPIRNAFQTQLHSWRNAFVSKVSPDGTALVYSTYLGGRKDFAEGNAIAVDGAGNASVTGFTRAADFPIRNALIRVLQGQEDAFVSKLDADGTGLVYSTYLGGARFDAGAAIALDGAGNAYVAGQTDSADFPIRDAVQSDLGGSLDAFVSKLSADGASLAYSTYFGGAGSDWGKGIAVDAAGNAYLAIDTNSPDVPTRNALQRTSGGDQDAFIAKLAGGSSASAGTPAGLVSLGDGSQDVAVLLKDSLKGALTVQVKDAAEQTLIQTLSFDAAYTPLDLIAVPDLNGNGSPELGVLGQRASDGRVQIEVKDSRTGNALASVAFNPAFAPKRLALLPDRNGNGASEFALLGVRTRDGAVAAELRDSRSGARLGQVSFTPKLTPADFSVVADVNGDSVPELAMLGVNASREVSVEIRDVRTGGLIGALSYPKRNVVLALAEVPDANGNKRSEIAVLEQGRVRSFVKTLDAATAASVGFMQYDAGYRPQQLIVLPDIDGNGVAEIAALGRDAGGQLKAEVRDALTGLAVRSLGYDLLNPQDPILVPDLDGNGAPELAVLGTSRAGAPQVLIKDPVTKALLSTLTF